MRAGAAGRRACSAPTGWSSGCAVETGQPTRDVALLMRLFRERIDALADPIDPGFGFDLIRLDVALAERLDAAQLKLEGGAVAEGAKRSRSWSIGSRPGSGAAACGGSPRATAICPNRPN